MTPETRLLRLCSAAPVTAERRERIRSLIQGPMDWEAFLRLAVRHRVFPLAFKALAPHAAEAVPSSIWESLRIRSFANLTKNMAAGKELARVAEALGREGVAAAAYKGPALAEQAYGDIGLRHFNDLDILIKEENLEAAAAVLHILGYKSDLPGSPVLNERYRRYLRDFAFWRPEGPCPVEVQWRLAQRYHPLFRDMSGLWTRLDDVVLEKTAVRTLSLEDTLLALCLHGLYHSWEHLQMVADVAQAAAAGPDLDWPGLLESARRQGGLRILLLGLLLARDLLEAPLPRSVLQAAEADRFVLRLAARTSEDFFDEASYPLKARSFFFLETRLISGLGNRVRYFWGRLVTPNEEDERALALPAGLFWLNPIWRAIRLFKKYFLAGNS